MKIKILELTSSEVVNVYAPHSPEFLSVMTNEDIALSENEVGFIVGKKKVSLKGVLCQPGVVHPGWRGKLEPFFTVYGRWVAKPGMSIAHLVVLSQEKV